MYSFFRSLLFKLDPEVAHALALNCLKICPQSFFPTISGKPIQAMGLHFQHGIGLAAGLDKNAMYLTALAKLGFAFIEIGTVTPRPQEGNPKPRLFRLPEAGALINRMGFNNLGIHTVIDNIKRANYQGILGINIGKNKTTPLQEATKDYTLCLTKAYPWASYITVNISSPNTPELRTLQTGNYFKNLIHNLHEAQKQLQDQYQRHVPLVVKISPDESAETLKTIAEVCLQHQISGIIATNTSCARVGVAQWPSAQETGGLSGPPIFEQSTASLGLLKQLVGNSLTLIGVGGIHNVRSAQAKLQAGAELLQIYTGLVYQGPALVHALIKGIQ